MLSSATLTFMAAFMAEWADTFNFMQRQSQSKTPLQAGPGGIHLYHDQSQGLGGRESLLFALDPKSPDANNDTAITNEDTPVVIDVLGNDTDGNGQQLTITHINGTAITAGGPGVAVTGGIVTLGNDGKLTFTPSANYNGSPSFTYTVRDPDGLTDTATVNLTVNAVNDAPSGADKIVVDRRGQWIHSSRSPISGSAIRSRATILRP